MSDEEEDGTPIHSHNRPIGAKRRRLSTFEDLDGTHDLESDTIGGSARS